MIGGFNLVGFDNFIEDLEQMPASITAKDVDYTLLFKDCIVNEAIDAQKLQDGIFPVNENYDIFISHSHDDEELAIKFKNFISWKILSRFSSSSYMKKFIKFTLYPKFFSELYILMSNSKIIKIYNRYKVWSISKLFIEFIFYIYKLIFCICSFSFNSSLISWEIFLPSII